MYSVIHSDNSSLLTSESATRQRCMRAAAARRHGDRTLKLAYRQGRSGDPSGTGGRTDCPRRPTEPTYTNDRLNQYRTGWAAAGPTAKLRCALATSAGRPRGVWGRLGVYLPHSIPAAAAAAAAAEQQLSVSQRAVILNSAVHHSSSARFDEMSPCRTNSRSIPPHLCSL